MGIRWQTFDQQLYGLKMVDVSQRFQEKRQTERKRVMWEVQQTGNSAGYGPDRIRGQNHR